MTPVVTPNQAVFCSSDQPPWSPECGMKPLGAEQTFPLVFFFNHQAVEHSMDFAGPRILKRVDKIIKIQPPGPQQVWETDVMGKGCHWTCGTPCITAMAAMEVLMKTIIMPQILCPWNFQKLATKLRIWSEHLRIQLNYGESPGLIAINHP